MSDEETARRIALQLNPLKVGDRVKVRAGTRCETPSVTVTDNCNGTIEFIPARHSDVAPPPTICVVMLDDAGVLSADGRRMTKIYKAAAAFHMKDLERI